MRRLAAVVVVAATAAMASRSLQAGGWALYGLIAMAAVGLKLTASLGHRSPASDEHPNAAAVAARARVGAIVPVHNEDPAALLACVRSVLDQPSVRVVCVVDDGSTDETCRTTIAELGRRWPERVRVLRFPTNRGKREALRAGMRQLESFGTIDLVATVDSDTVLAPDAVVAASVVLAMKPDTGAVTGLVRAANWRTNVLTRLQDLRYASAFLWERAAYSRAGAVLCVCGSFTLWRAGLLSGLVDPLVAQRWAGQRTTYGDDRHLTNLALRAGWRIRLAETAVADTLVPERLGHWLRQQTRWSRSFIRESLWAVRNLPAGWALVLTFVEFVTWVVLTLALFTALVVRPLAAGTFAIGTYLLWTTVMSWARSVRFFEARPEASWRDRLLSFALAPVYGLLHLGLLLPLRLVALCTMTDTRWGTRAEVEVGLTDSGPSDRAPAPATRSTIGKIRPGGPPNPAGVLRPAPPHRPATALGSRPRPLPAAGPAGDLVPA
jgi:hyaluronan synthase